MKSFGIIVLFFFFLDNHGQLLTGRISYIDGKPVIGASVWIKEKGGVVGAITDINGNYTLKIDSTCLTLCASYFDCFTECLKIDNRKEINIALKENPIELRKIKVIAFVDRNFDIISIDKTAEDSTILLFKYLCDNIEYPIRAIKSGVQGKVLVKFKIDSADFACSAEIIRGLDNSIDNNIKRIVQSYPDWKSVILTDEMIINSISPDIYGFSFWLRTEKEYLLPVDFMIKETNDK